MKTRKINSVYTVGVAASSLFFCLIAPSVWAGVSMSDAQLSEQTRILARLTPNIITAVKTDLVQSTEAQNIIHTQLAQKHADKEKETQLYSSVLTVYELEKKNMDTSNTADQYISPEIPFRLVSVAESPYHRSDIRITTEDKITVYLGRDGNGN